MLRFLMLVALALLGACATTQDQGPMQKTSSALDIERVFSSPTLDGPAPAKIKIAPDGSLVGFLRGSAENSQRYDLWVFDPAIATSRLLVESAALTDGTEELSDEERARRERQRISSLSGIIDYHFSPDGRSILFPLSGDLYLYELASGTTRALTHTKAAEIDPKFSPLGRYVSFVRDRELMAIDLSTGETLLLTSGASDTVANGLAEFIAQEEMGRDTGYWWAPDDSAIAYLQYDESPVALEQRYEVYAGGIQTIEQRYPATGTANVINRLAVVRLDDIQTTWLDLGADTDIYVPRVNWSPAADYVLVQRQSRNQQSLELLRYSATGGAPKTLIAETHDTWVDIYDDLRFANEGQDFIWSSARGGNKHLYLYTASGELKRQLTAGDWSVVADRSGRALVHVDFDHIYFIANEEHATERHLYRSSLGDSDVTRPEKISKEPGWHSIAFASSGEFYVDRYSGGDTPPRVTVHSRNGTVLGPIEENTLDRSHPYYQFQSDHTPMEFGELTAEDGQTLHYYLRKPEGASATNKRPVIVIVYGGPGGQRVTNAWGNLIEQVMVERGYVVFSLDNRGTGYRGRKFDDIIYRDLGIAEVRDQALGAEFLRTLDYVDGERIGVYGWSYGGYMALHCLLQSPGTFSAGVAGAPVTDWKLYDTHYTERYLGTPADNAAGYEAGSVFPYVDALEAPLLLMHGMADDNVLFSHSTELMRALQAGNKRFELMTYPGSKHSLIRGQTDGVHAWTTILDFFDRHLAAR